MGMMGNPQTPSPERQGQGGRRVGAVRGLAPQTGAARGLSGQERKAARHGQASLR